MTLLPSKSSKKDGGRHQRIIHKFGLACLSILILIPSNLDALTCSTCDVQKCPRNLECSGGTTVNVCGCCLECARVINETCGGPYFMNGKCDQGLVCVIIPSEGQTVSGEEMGICREIPNDISSKSCDGVICSGDSTKGNPSSKTLPQSKDPILECPADSVAVTTRKNSNLRPACCPEGLVEPAPVSTTCKCQPCAVWPGTEEKSGDSLNQAESSPCDPEFMRILKTEGLGTPGQCCDVYECVKQAVVCERVECDEDLMLEPVCPQDSYLLPTTVTQDGCCFSHQGCACKAKESCPEVKCTDGLKKRIRKISNGLPGSCCDEYDCVNDMNPTCLQNSTRYLDGSTWLSDACTACACRGGLTFCQPLPCPPVPRCGWMGTPEGECCPVCKGCVSQTGELYSNGAVWKQDNCVTCHCSGGQVYCQAEMCSSRCSNPRVIEGECCPVCDENPGPTLPEHCPELANCSLMCLYGYQQDENGCYKCQCVNSDGSTLCTLQCPDGFMLDTEGNRICECKKTESSTTSGVTTSVHLDLHPDPDFNLDPSDPDISGLDPDDLDLEIDFITPTTTMPSNSMARLVSPSGKTEDDNLVLGKNDVIDLPDESENVIKSSTNILQDSMSIKSTSASVTSADHVTSCPLLIGCSKQCFYGYKLDSNGCPTCLCYKCPAFDCTKKCLSGYAVNAEGCRLCKCIDTGLSEVKVTTVAPQIPPLGGRHCSAVDGQKMEEGQSWWDGCRKCFCHEGHEMCALITCPPVKCSNPVMRLGSCCLSCSGDAVGPVGPLGTSACFSADGRYFVEGETWLLDECTQCICHKGTALCAIEVCPPILCTHPSQLQNTCCPRCPGQPHIHNEYSRPHMNPSYNPPGLKDYQIRKVCISSTGYYLSGDSWRVNDCQSCVCRDGQIHCFSQTCPILQCTKFIQKKGQCCPMCIDDRDRTCSHGGEIYSFNESWIVDDCTKCTCAEGSQVLCKVSVCEEVKNSCEMIRVPGTCCPVCKDLVALNGTSGGLDNSKGHFILTSHPAILTLIAIIVLLFLIVLLLLLRRRYKLKTYWVSHPEPSGFGSYSPSKHQAAGIGGVAPVSCKGFDGCYMGEDSPPLSGVRNGYDFQKENPDIPYSTATGSTRFSMSLDGSLMRAGSPALSSLCDEPNKDDFDNDSCVKPKDYFNDKISNDDGEYNLDESENKFCGDSGDVFSEKVDNGDLSSSRSTVDIRAPVHDDVDEDSDETTDSTGDSCFESSKQLIEKKRRNRRSAGEELEKQARRRSMLSPSNLPTERPKSESNAAANINRRSW